MKTEECLEMEPFGRSPECNKMLSFHEEIQQVLYPQCGLMKWVCCWGGGAGQGGGGVSCKGRGKCEYMCSDLLFPTTSLGFCHANLRAFTLQMHIRASH